MSFPGSLRAIGLRRAFISTAIAGVGACVLLGYLQLNRRNGTSLAGWVLLLLFLIAIGATAGLVSGRFRDALASWVGTIVGWVIAALAIRAIDPNVPAGDTTVEGTVIIGSILILPLIVGGHLLGAAVAKRNLRGRQRRGLRA